MKTAAAKIRPSSVRRERMRFPSFATPSFRSRRAWTTSIPFSEIIRSKASSATWGSKTVAICSSGLKAGPCCPELPNSSRVWSVQAAGSW